MARYGTALVGIALLGCGENEPPPAEDDGHASTSGPAAETGATSGGIDGSSSSETTADVPDVELPALGIEVTRVELNQGVSIPVYPGEAPMAPVLADRPGIVHAAFELEGDFEPREIVARLELHGPDGELGTIEDRRAVDRAPTGIADGFAFALEAKDFQPGLELRVSLWEAQPGPDRGAAHNTAPVAPRDVVVQETRTRLQVTLVPMSNDLDLGSCPRPAPDVAAAEIAQVRARLEVIYPVQSVDVTVRDPVSLDFEVDGLGEFELFAALADLRVEDDAAPGQHYVALVEPCVGDNGEWLSPTRGVSPINDEPDEQTQDAAHLRVMVVPYVPWDLDFTYLYLLPHELGHNLGRKHVECTGDELDPDPIYPHEGGVIGANGWHPPDGTIYPPDTPDLMGYCTQVPNWVSAFGWGRVFPVLEAQAGWPSKHVGPIRRLAIGDTTAGTPTRWHTFRARGDVPIGPGRFADADSTFTIVEHLD